MSDHDNTPDETLHLLRAWQTDGDKNALGQLIGRNLDFVRTKVRERLGDRLRRVDESMDLVQEVAMDALQYGPRFVVSNRAQLRAILAKMVENNIRDRNRWRHSQKRDMKRERPLGASIDLSASRSANRPDARMEKAELAEMVRLAVELLDDDDREIIQLHQIDQRPMAEVAEALEIKIQAARMRYRRALPRLAKQVQDLLSGDLPTEP